MITVSLVVAGLISLVGTGVAKTLLIRGGAVDQPSERSSHRAPTPRGAGIPVALAMVAATLVALVDDWASSSVLSIFAVFVAAATVVGAVEDAHGLPIPARLAAQLAVGAFAAAGLGSWAGASFWATLIGASCIVGFINVANFMDGVDGLSGFYGIVVGAAFMVIGGIWQVGWLGIVGAILAVAFGGFLPWNLVGRGIFLGDSGSYALGAAVAIGVMGGTLAGVPPIGLVGPVVIYLADTSWTLVSRIVRGEPWYRSHRQHIYHRLEDRGYGHLAVSGVVVGASAFTAGTGIVAAALGGAWWITAFLAWAIVIAAYLASPRLFPERQRERAIVLAVTVPEQLVYLDGLPRALVEDGWRVHVVCSPGSRLEDLRAVATVHLLPMRRELAPFADLLSLVRWIVLLLRVRPLVVSAGSPKASLLAMSAAAFTRVPVRRYVVYGLRLETTTGPLRRVLTAVERFTMAAATDVEPVGPSLARRIGDMRLVDPTKVAGVRSGSVNGVDEQRFRPALRGERAAVRERLGLDVDRTVIGFVGRITADKGLGTLAEALGLLGPRSIQVLVVGELDDPQAQALLDELDRAGFPVVHAGYQLDPAQLYRAMDVLVLPSRREGFPNVVLEAAASGVPSVVSDATGAIDSVDHGATGLIAAVGDAEAFANHLATLIDDPAMRERLGEGARARVLATFRATDHRAALISAIEASAVREAPTRAARSPEATL